MKTGPLNFPPPISPDEIRATAQRFEAASPQRILVWAVEHYWPTIAMSSSFQSQSLVLLHMVKQVAPTMPILFLDTGYHFPETLAFRHQLADEWGLTVYDVRPAINAAQQATLYGPDLPQRDPDWCCELNKVRPLQATLTGLLAWVTGIRRDQTSERAQAAILEPQPSGLLKINPLLNWTKKQVWQYIHDHNLPTHPLLEKGYLSIGCAPCTRAIHAGEDERAGRWAGTAKTECGLHTTPHTL